MDEDEIRFNGGQAVLRYIIRDLNLSSRLNITVKELQQMADVRYKAPEKPEKDSSKKPKK